MKIEKGSKVQLHYTLHLDNAEGEIVEKTTDENPLSFEFGSGEMLADFENSIAGLKAGEPFEISIPCERAYGAEDEDAYVEYPLTDFMDEEGQLDTEPFEEGEVIELQTDSGDTLMGVVAEIKKDSIVVDFNHPLADENLYFTGTILSIE